MAKQLINKLSNVLQIESSSEKNATDFYQQVTRSASSIGVGLPSLPRCFGSRSQRQNIITFSEDFTFTVATHFSNKSRILLMTNLIILLAYSKNGQVNQQASAD